MPDDKDQSTPIDPLTSDELLSLAEAANLSGLSMNYLRTIAIKGRLRAKKIGRNWVTTMAAIEEYKNSRSMKNIPKKYRQTP
jgi:hypothetical protein